MTIRQAVAADVPALAALLQGFYAESGLALRRGRPREFSIGRSAEAAIGSHAGPTIFPTNAGRRRIMLPAGR